VLNPGRLYRLDVDLSWSGWLHQQDESGNRVLAAAAGPNPAPTRSYFFATADPEPDAPAVDQPGWRIGDAGYFEFLYHRRDLFRPEMLARHLRGYTPAQSETARFRDDPLRAHFAVAHVAALARAYGFELTLELRRVDLPGPAGEPVELVPSWVALTEPARLTAAGRRRTEVAATALCPLPKPGATLQAHRPLAPQAWYEVAVLARSDDPTHIADGRLDGVTFRTSRWRDPADLLAGIGLHGIGGRATGDLAVPRLPALDPALLDGQDAAFEAALDGLGLDGWPVTDQPRLSVLWWRADGLWRCAGMLLESPEPIERPGRLELLGPRLASGQPSRTGIFDRRRSDRSRSRLLILTSTPFVPRRWRPPLGPPRRPTAHLDFVDRLTGTTVTGSLPLPQRPSFAVED
jgi:hypothetical protein